MSLRRFAAFVLQSILVITFANFLPIHDAQLEQPVVLPEEIEFRIPDPSNGNQPELAARPQVYTGLPAVYGNTRWDQYIYSTWIDSDWEIKFLQPEVNTGLNLTNNTAQDLDPDFDGNTQTIVFASNSQSGDFDLYSLKLDGSGLKALTVNNWDERDPSWSLDGKQIAFARKLDSTTYNIFLINADGTAERRLTDTPGKFNGMPAWSPDGKSLAYVSNRGGKYQIWVTTLSTGETRMVSSDKECVTPVWSADGSEVYASCLTISGYFEFIHGFRVSTGAQRIVFYPRNHKFVNALLEGLAVNGRHLEVVCEYTDYDGNIIGYKPYLYDLDPDPAEDHVPDFYFYETVRGKDVTGFEMNSLDPLPPVTYGPVLAPFEPGYKVITWTGADGGSSGIKYYLVEALSNDQSPFWWVVGEFPTPEFDTSKIGIDKQKGMTFRIRAVDYANNIERVKTENTLHYRWEQEGPFATISDPPAYIYTNETVLFQGSIVDLGGTGLWWASVFAEGPESLGGDAFYISQTKPDGSRDYWAWMKFLWDDPGEYRFGINSQDLIQNKGRSALSTPALLYDGGKFGTVMDITGAPVSGVDPISAMQALRKNISGWLGKYGIVFANPVYPQPKVFSLTWAREGFQDLPLTTYPFGWTPQTEVFLPPADDLIANGGFEDGVTLSSWDDTGITPAQIVQRPRHSGENALSLGAQMDVMAGETLAKGWSTYKFSSAVDGLGTLHTVWQGDDHIPKYSQKPNGGEWTEMVDLLAASSESYPQVTLQAQDDGGLHVLLTDKTAQKWMKYLFRSPVGIWSTAVDLPIIPTQYHPQASRANSVMLLDGNNHPQVLYEQVELTSSAVYSTSSNGTIWSDVQLVRLAEGRTIDQLYYFERPNGEYTAVWLEGEKTGYQVFSSNRSNGGVWSAPVPLSEFVYPSHEGEHFQVVQGPDQRVHISFVWSDFARANQFNSIYRVQNLDGSWQPAEELFDLSNGSTYYRLAPLADGRLLVIFFQGRQAKDTKKQMVERIRSADGEWSEQVLEFYTSYEMLSNVLVDSEGGIHLAIQSLVYYPYYQATCPDPDMFTTGETAVYHLHRLSNGSWVPPQPVGCTGGSTVDPIIQLDPQGSLHIFAQTTPTYRKMKLFTVPSRTGVGDSAVKQTLSLPGSLTNAGISFLYMGGGFSSDQSYFQVNILDGDQKINLLTNHSGIESWQHEWISLSDWVGKTVTLEFVVHGEEGENAPWIVLDEVSVGSAFPNVGLNLTASTKKAAPGDEVTLTIETMGSVLTAQETQISLTLPEGLIPLSASSPYTQQANVLTWHLGMLDISARQPIQLTVQVDPTQIKPQELTVTARITTTSPEIDTLNNVSVVQITNPGKDFRIYLPALIRK